MAKKLTGKQITGFSIFSALAILAIDEAIALFNKEEGDTISARLHDIAISYPAILALPAAVCVHCSTPTRKTGENLPWWQGPIPAFIGAIGIGLAWARYDRSR